MATKQKIITNKIKTYLFENPNRLIPTKELVSAVYGNAINMQSRKRYIDVCICKEIRPELKKTEYQDKNIRLVSVRRIGLKLEIPT